MKSIEKEKQYQREYYLKNRADKLSKQKERQRKLSKDDPEYFAKHYARYIEDQRQHRKEKSQLSAFRAAASVRKKRWDINNPDKVKEKRHKRRAREANAEGSFKMSDFRALCEKFDNTCLCCRQIKVLTVDHIKPLAKGGSNMIENLQPLCLECNLRKGTKEHDYRSEYFKVLC